MNWVEHFKVAVRRAKTPRNQVLVALAFALPHLTVAELARLRVEDVTPLLRSKGDSLPVQVALRLFSRRTAGYVFVSRKGKPRPGHHGIPDREPQPASRITIWRALHAAVGGGVETVRLMLAATPAPPPTPAPTPPQPRVPTRPTLSDGLAKPGG